MKILITGGKGFIGSRIVEELSKDNQVTVLDNSDGYGIVEFNNEELLPFDPYVHPLLYYPIYSLLP